MTRERQELLPDKPLPVTNSCSVTIPLARLNILIDEASKPMHASRFIHPSSVFRVDAHGFGRGRAVQHDWSPVEGLRLFRLRNWTNPSGVRDQAHRWPLMGRGHYRPAAGKLGRIRRVSGLAAQRSLGRESQRTPLGFLGFDERAEGRPIRANANWKKQMCAVRGNRLTFVTAAIPSLCRVIDVPDPANP